MYIFFDFQSKKCSLRANASHNNFFLFWRKQIMSFNQAYDRLYSDKVPKFWFLGQFSTLLDPYWQRLLICLSKLATIPRSVDGSCKSCRPSFVRTLKINLLKSSFSSTGGISAVSLRVSPFVWKNSVKKATSRFVFLTVFWFWCSSVNISIEPSKEANLELAMLDPRIGVKLAGCDCPLVNFRRSRFWLANDVFFTGENSSFAFPIG